MATKRTKKQVKKSTNKTKAIVLSSREAPIQRKLSPTDIISSVMAKAQLEVLTADTPDYAIKTRPGAKGKLLRYVSHGYVTDKLNKTFGFDWDFKLLPYFDNGSVYHLETVQVGVNAKTKEIIYARYISVYGELTVRIHNPKKLAEVIATVTKPGPGSSVWYPENEFGDALKSAKSDGLKVAAHELGIALDLYWDDSAEFQKYELSQQEKAKQETDEIIEGMTSDEEESNAPTDGVSLLLKAQSLFGMDLLAVQKVLGKDFVTQYQSDMWDKLVKSREGLENNETKQKGT